MPAKTKKQVRAGANTKGKLSKNSADKEAPKLKSTYLSRLPEPVTLGDKIKRFFIENLFVILAFAVPFILMTVAFGLMCVSPFGDKQILVTDLWHQYFPFLVDFHDKLQHGESLFWSWTQGGGVNYFALMSYYLVSPLNFLSVFLPSEVLREFLMFSVVIKIACGGGFMAIFLRSIFKRNDFSLVIFGCGFSFCAFFMGYYWNTIWLDTVCITPLVVLGAIKLLEENKFRLYVITLALSLLCNYYIGLFTCIFMLLVFIGYSVVRWDGIKVFFQKLIRMGVFSLMGIGMTVFFLLPAFFALQNTNASGSTFPSTFAVNFSVTPDFMGVLDALRKILSNFNTFIEPATKEADALPNIACGTVSLVLGIMFFTSSKIKLREKLVDLSLVLFMLVSCIIRQLDYIWHGFHFTNMIPYRFSYLVSFVLVVMAFRAFMLIEHSTILDVILTALFSALIILMSIGTQQDYVIIGTAIIAFVVCGALTLYVLKVVPKTVLLIILSLVVIGESGATAYIGVKTTSVTSTYWYPRGDTTPELMDELEEREADTTEMWRAETTNTYTLNEGSLIGFDGLSMFNSMANVNMTRLFENIGLMGWKSGNRYTYAESTPIANTFLNLKYLISITGQFNNTYDLKTAYKTGNERLLENQHYIPMGFMVNSNLSSWQIDDNEDVFNMFDTQSEFFRLATGVNQPVYTPLEVTSTGHTPMDRFSVTKTSYGHYSFSPVALDANEKPHLKWNYEAPEDGYYSFYTHITNGNSVKIMINDEYQSQDYNMQRSYIAMIGKCNKGDKISVWCEFDDSTNATGSAQVYVNKFNTEVFEQGFANISKDVMNTTSLSGSSMEGTINVTQDGLFYTSVPYEEGWTAYVDGEKAEITPVGDALIAFPLSKGEHTIKLVYYPKGFWPGFAVSATCLAAFIFLCVYQYRIKKKKVMADSSAKGDKE